MRSTSDAQHPTSLASLARQGCKAASKMQAQRPTFRVRRGRSPGASTQAQWIPEDLMRQLALPTTAAAQQQLSRASWQSPFAWAFADAPAAAAPARAKGYVAVCALALQTSQK